jgi:hypothetical protein
MWSFNREGECDESLKADRNRVMGIDTDAKSGDRQSFLPLTHPQCGVDAMKDEFPGSTPIPGVVDVHAVDG